MLVHYPEDMPLRDARRIYFDANHFGEDGGYGAKWVDFKLGQIPFPIPNAPSRVRPVRFHDLHHVLTGYDTSTIGEFEISAWEIAAGCRGFAAAWVLHLSGMFAGMLVAPRRTFLAFVRGRRSRTLYGETLRPLARRDSERRPCAVPAGRRRRPGERCGRRRSWHRSRRGRGRRARDDRDRLPLGAGWALATWMLRRRRAREGMSGEQV